MSNHKVQAASDEHDISFRVFTQDSEFIEFLKSPRATQIHTLNISHTLLTDQALLQLCYTPSKRLRHLDISYCVNFTEGAIVNLLNCDLMFHIEVLNLSGNLLSDITLRYLLQSHKLKNLAQLQINDIRKGQQGFTYKFFEYLTTTTLQKTLHTLSIANSFVPLDQLQPTKPQMFMNQIFNKLINEDATFFYQLSLKSTSISQLILNRCELLTNKFFKVLAKNNVFLQSLKVIDVSHCRRLNDKSLRYLSDANGVGNLQELMIAGLKITQNGLDKFAKGKNINIQHLNISMCDELTGQDVRSFMETKVGKQLISLELSGSGSISSQIAGCFTSEFIIWKDFQLRLLNVELYLDKAAQYQIFSKEQLAQMSTTLDPFYKGFIENHCQSIFLQLVFVKKIKVVLKVQLQDEAVFLEYLTQFVETNKLLDKILQHDNSLFVNNICYLSHLLATITKAKVKIKELDLEPPWKSSFIQQNYIDPIQKENVHASQIKNLIFLNQERIFDFDLELIQIHSQSLFSQLQYLSFKGCRNITLKGIRKLAEGFGDTLQFLDVRKTQVGPNSTQELLSLFPNLSALNNNKVQFTILKNTSKDDCLGQLQLLEQLQGVQGLKMEIQKKVIPLNLVIIQKMSKLLRMSYINMKKLTLELNLEITTRTVESEEILIELQENLQMSYNLKVFKLVLNGRILHSILCDLVASLMNNQLQSLSIDVDKQLYKSCVLVDEIAPNYGHAAHNFAALQIVCQQNQSFEYMFPSCINLAELSLKFELGGNYRNLLLALQSNCLINLDLEVYGPRNEFLAEMLSQLNCERLVQFQLSVSKYKWLLASVQLSEAVLQKLSECLGRCKKLQKVVCQMIGCTTDQMMARYFKGNSSILRIPEIRFFY